MLNYDNLIFHGGKWQHSRSCEISVFYGRCPQIGEDIGRVVTYGGPVDRLEGVEQMEVGIGGVHIGVREERLVGLVGFVRVLFTPVVAVDGVGVEARNVLRDVLSGNDDAGAPRRGAVDVVVVVEAGVVHGDAVGEERQGVQHRVALAVQQQQDVAAVRRHLDLQILVVVVQQEELNHLKSKSLRSNNEVPYMTEKR